MIMFIIISTCLYNNDQVLKLSKLQKKNVFQPFEWWDVHMRQGLNSHYFHIIGDGHQPNSRGLYTHYKDSY